MTSVFLLHAQRIQPDLSPLDNWLWAVTLGKVWLKKPHTVGEPKFVAGTLANSLSEQHIQNDCRNTCGRWEFCIPENGGGVGWGF